MKTARFFTFLALLTVGLSACDEGIEDKIPVEFFMIQLNPDDIFLYPGSEYGVRLDPLVNDSIKVEVTIAYSTPSFGTLTFIQNEGWFYKPNEGFTGIDNIIYTVCYKEECYAASITLYVEEPLDIANCTTVVNHEEVTTARNQPIGIPIFQNDVACPYQGSSIFAPTKGMFTTYTYSGSFKNTVYVYYPPKNFTGTDQFKYRLFTSDGYVEGICTITITE